VVLLPGTTRSIRCDRRARYERSPTIVPALGIEARKGIVFVVGMVDAAGSCTVVTAVVELKFQRRSAVVDVADSHCAARERQRT